MQFHLPPRSNWCLRLIFFQLLLAYHHRTRHFPYVKHHWSVCWWLLGRYSGFDWLIDWLVFYWLIDRPTIYTRLCHHVNESSRYVLMVGMNNSGYNGLRTLHLSHITVHFAIPLKFRIMGFYCISLHSYRQKLGISDCHSYLLSWKWHKSSFWNKLTFVILFLIHMVCLVLSV